MKIPIVSIGSRAEKPLIPIHESKMMSAVISYRTINQPYNKIPYNSVEIKRK